MGGAVEIRPRGAGLQPCRAGRWADMNTGSVGEVDDNACLASAKPGIAVAAAADRKIQLMIPGKVDTGQHIRHSGNPHNGRRPFINHSVEDGSR
jgi:hypothetical protein